MHDNPKDVFSQTIPTFLVIGCTLERVPAVPYLYYLSFMLHQLRMHMANIRLCCNISRVTDIVPILISGPTSSL